MSERVPMQSESVRWPQQSNMFPTDIKKYDVDEQLSLTICFPCRLKFLCCQYRHQLIMRSAIVRLRKEHNNNNDTLVTWCMQHRSSHIPEQPRASPFCFWDWIQYFPLPRVLWRQLLPMSSISGLSPLV